MKCFNHPDREAVATCQACGKGLCRECASKYRPCLCDDCYQDNVDDEAAMRRLRKKDALVDTNMEMLKTTILGLVLGAAMTAFFMYMFKDYGFTTGSGIGFFIFFFGVPFGWKGITYIESLLPTPRFFIISFYFLIVWYVIKLMIALCIGIPLFIFQLIKWLVNVTRLTNEKNKI